MIRNKIKSHIWYPFAMSWIQFFFGLILFGLALLFFFVLDPPKLNIGLKTNWDFWLSAYIAMATLLFAVFIWYNDKRMTWRSTLPKKLNINYLHNNKCFCEVINAPLTGESDIRNWGQSIGQTILNGFTRINFSGFKISKPVLDYNRLFLVYQLDVYLHSKIEGINDGEVFNFNDDGNLIQKPSVEKETHELLKQQLKLYTEALRTINLIRPDTDDTTKEAVGNLVEQLIMKEIKKIDETLKSNTKKND
jgi:hypothetical protein